ncbi:MAG: sensor histidine kinase [Chloroflexi bacterium]|nr:sensor histidine kinase [Chloroflexota bacterium]
MRYLGPLVGLIFLVAPLGHVLTMPHPPWPRWPSLAGLVLFALIWGFLISRGPGWNRPRVLRAGFLLLTALALGYTLGLGGELIWLFLYVGVLAGFILPSRQSAAAIAAAAAIATLAGLAIGIHLAAIAQVVGLQVSLSFLMLTTQRLIIANARLEEAREDIARLAVSEERLRFARDLHDLLGHRLSAIALKTELARRLAIADPHRAEREISDVEVMVREALREVREAVAGYRQPRLSDELSGAREVLAAAGISYLLDDPPDQLPPAVESVLAWTVREGITNIVRHSRAQHCAVRFRVGDDAVAVEVLDDGCGSTASGEGSSSGAGGSGLRGLAERLAAVGGVLEAGPLPARGFSLRATIPLGALLHTERLPLEEGIR